jgi:hypothetical protein
MPVSNYVKQWVFTENGNAYDLTKISSVNRYETKVMTPQTEYVVVLDNKENLLVSENEAREILKALVERESNIERIVNNND